VAHIGGPERFEMLAENDESNARSWDRLFRCWRSVLLVCAGRILQDGDEAEDVLQDVLLLVVARDPALQSTSYRYLRTAVRNRAIAIVRERRLHAHLLEHKRQPSAGLSGRDS
jgi:DNA-directed RNA polymerase specialized sigma24 family protein